ncbi:complement C3-like [Clarias gariepinus]
MMHADVMWLVAVFLSFPLVTQCVPMYIMSAPQILRVGSEEQVLVEAQDYDGTDSIKVYVRVMNFPSKHTDLGNYPLTLDSKNNYQALVNITIPFIENVFNVDSDEQQYVYLTANFPGNTVLEKIVMVSFQSGHLFVQTDKTIYTPESTVKYRIFAVNSKIKPVDNTVVVKIITPEGIVVEQKQLTIKKGIVGFQFKLGNPISNGIWKIAASFKENPNKNFTADFEVKEYRLPSFEVNLTPEKSFFYADDEKFSVLIKAKYLFGETVEGSAFVVFGVFNGTEKRSIQSSLNRVDITKGEGTAELKREQICQTFPDIKAIIGHTLYIAVSVLTESGSEMVEAERRGIHIVTSPYTIHFTRTPKYFKPGMPFNLMVYVVNPDETPAKKLELLLTESDKPNSSQEGKTMENGMAMFTVNTKQTETILKITVKTNDEKLQKRKEAQAENSLTATAYASILGSKNYLHIGLPTEELMIEKQFSVTMNIQTSQTNHEISYMILSKGQIVSTSKLKRGDNPVMAVQFSITKDMLPSFRILAYYHVGNSEVVADSIWVDVKDTCIGTLQVEIDDPRPAYAPNDEIKLKLTASPQSNVYLVAVDKGVYVLNNKNRLTQTKIWDSVEEHDIGCTAGSGKDSMGVFYDAGLLFVSNTQIRTADRRETSCAHSKRQRRAITKSQLLNNLVNEYNATLKQCCRDGMVENFLGYTCERRSEYIVDGAECRKAFLNCCQKLADLKKDAVQGELHLARSEEDEVNDLSDEITSRSNFPESWMWDKVEITNCGANKKCDSVHVKNDQTLPDSITTWVITAVSISDDDGICVADPYEVLVKKEFFVDLKLPYSAAVNEQIEIKAIIYNLENTRLKKVFVELKENEEICSMASFREKYRTTVSIDSKSSRAVPFVIIPIKAGQFEVEVKVISLDPLRTDGVKKKLKVVTQGVQTTTGEVTLILEPDRYGGEQRSEFKRPFLENKMPDTEAHTYIAVRGRPLAQMVNEALSGKGLERLIKQPYGCAEQNLMAMVLPLITTHYLDKTNQWNDVGVDKRTEALNYISTGYVTELKYRIADKSFSFNGNKGSTWLTAYVVKMFSLAKDLIYLEDNVICDAVNWLITNAQMSDGQFFEVTRATSSAMAGRSSHVTVTSFVLIALQEARQICHDKIPMLSQHMSKAASYISNNIRNTDDPYAVAMASCALANSGQLDSSLLFNFASSDRSHWPVGQNHFFTLEATGYALLALLEVRDFERAKPLVRWLKTNQEFNGGYHSTQSTAVVFQAIAKYMIAKPPSTDGSLSVL